MSEIWVAAVGVVGSVAAGKAAEKKAKEDRKHSEAMTAEESKLAAQRTGYERALDEWYTQRERARKQRGLAQFRDQFSTMSQWAPGYDESTEVTINPGQAPQYNDFAPADPELGDPNARVSGKSGGKSLSDIHKKLRDPLGLF